MAEAPLSLNIEYFNDPATGRPITSGSVYIGQPDLDPEILANRVSAVIIQEDGTRVTIAAASQPLSIGAGGRIMYAGEPVAVYVDGTYSLKVTTAAGQKYYRPRANESISTDVNEGLLVLNGSFENETQFTGVPDNWTLAAGTNGTIAIDSADQAHGLNSLKFTGTDSTGGGTATSEKFSVLKGGNLYVEFTYKSSSVSTLNKVQVKYYNSLSAVVSTDTVYSEGSANPTAYQSYMKRSAIPATAVQGVIVLTGLDGAGTTVIGTTNFDHVFVDHSYFTNHNNVDTIIDLRNISPINDQVIYLKGHTAISDGGGGEFIGVTGATPGTYTDDNGITILPSGGDGSTAWIRKYNGDIYVKWFGATGDGVTDDTTAIQAAIDSIPSESSGVIKFDASDYYITTTLNINTTGLNTKGVKLEGINPALFGLSPSVKGSRLITDQAIDMVTIGNASVTIWNGSVIEGITFSDTSASNNQVTSGIHIKRSNMGAINNCDFQDLTVGIGIRATGTGGNPQYWTVRDCRWHNVKYGVYHTSTSVDWTIIGGVFWGVTVGDPLISGSVGFFIRGTVKMFGVAVQYCETCIQLTDAAASKIVGCSLENDPGQPGNYGIHIVSGDGCQIISTDIVNGFSTAFIHVSSGVSRTTILSMEDTTGSGLITDNGTGTLILDNSASRDSKIPGQLQLVNGLALGGTGSPTFTSGIGSPEGVITASIGSIYSAVNGSTGTTLYVKEAGVGNTGWAAK